MPLDLIARFDCLTGAREAVMDLLTGYAAEVLVAPGVERFEFYTERARPDAVVVLERYTDAAAFQAHLDDPANARFNRELAPLVAAGGSRLTFLERAEASC